MTAWEVLIKCGITELPVDLGEVCRQLSIGLYSYSQGYDIIQRHGLVKHIHDTDGLLFRQGDHAIVLYNQTQNAGRRNFTIAHEIGHHVLEHHGMCGGEPVRREPGNKDNPEEREADKFAAQLLAPCCVIRGLGLRSSMGIAQTCHISRAAADVCQRKMERLYELDARYQQERGQSCFFRSSLEWRLYKQFEPFIKESVKTRRLRFHMA